MTFTLMVVRAGIGLSSRRKNEEGNFEAEVSERHAKNTQMQSPEDVNSGKSC